MVLDMSEALTALVATKMASVKGNMLSKMEDGGFIISLGALMNEIEGLIRTTTLPKTRHGLVKNMLSLQQALWALTHQRQHICEKYSHPEVIRLRDLIEEFGDDDSQTDLDKSLH